MLSAKFGGQAMSIMVFLKVAHWSLRHELSHHEGLLFNQDRVIIPSSLGTSLLDKLHAAHRGPEDLISRLAIMRLCVYLILPQELQLPSQRLHHEY